MAEKAMILREGFKGDPSMLSGAALAYIGDGVYEMLVREYLLCAEGVAPSALHRTAVKYVSAKAQFEAYKKISTSLSEKEAAIFARGRNSEVAAGKKKDPLVHCHATGFEALFGYLYLQGERDRLNELFYMIMNNQ